MEKSMQYYEDLFNEKADTPTLVNVKARQYPHLTLYKCVSILPSPSLRIGVSSFRRISQTTLPYSPGKYEVVLKHGGGLETIAEWEVKTLAESRKAKNVRRFTTLFFLLHQCGHFISTGHSLRR
jgi:hypothetical protein